ncbi:thymidylate kinase [Desulfosporosinus acidiphilus SJ4]|uniref:Thymidylate kinase n=1 Tax=Desulfosporosinus acidiphilus (strain DSM 22704 / JCM 16185 / SJ4) TaxID=646529 RepID=I4D893_DESAJ|nr:deoxynucleoside kinase [Desulfosporosinus acidiphilus]AFM42017.1 thymidylate kinase [Desulfosporosinus acidiphilus SJ4]
MKGKLIVIEAGDGSGKATQTKLLFDRLNAESYNIKKIEFPDYESDSSALIKMYLKGEFGRNPADVNPYAASTFYSVDRYASYKKEWEDFYLSGGIILADRYTTSNMVHQAAKISDEEERKAYLRWLSDLEFEKFKLPVPDCVIFLDMNPHFSQKLIKNRENKFGDKDKDIHESNFEYLVHSYDTACEIGTAYHWQRVNCVSDDKLRSIEEIHKDIYVIVKQLLNG